MLRITVIETPTERRLVPAGEPIEPWVSELKSVWEDGRRTRRERNCVIDLDDVTFIDEDGERILRTMRSDGAQLVASGLLYKYVIERSDRACATRSRRKSPTAAQLETT